MKKKMKERALLNKKNPNKYLERLIEERRELVEKLDTKISGKKE